MATDSKFEVGQLVRVLSTCPMPSWRGAIGRITRVWQSDIAHFGDGKQINFCYLEPALSPGRALTADGSVRVNEEQAEALKPKEDPYTAWRQSQGATFAAQLEGRTVEEFIAEQVDRYSVGRGDRKRLVAALAVELSKPVTLRFPAEGRSDRALSVTNGMIRGRE